MINYKLRTRRLALGMTESQVAEEVSRLVANQTGRKLAIDGNYISKLERGIITWPNQVYRKAFRDLFNVSADTELGFFSSRTRKDAERWNIAPPRAPSEHHDLVFPLRHQQ